MILNEIFLKYYTKEHNRVKIIENTESNKNNKKTEYRVKDQKTE